MSGTSNWTTSNVQFGNCMQEEETESACHSQRLSHQGRVMIGPVAAHSGRLTHAKMQMRIEFPWWFIPLLIISLLISIVLAIWIALATWAGLQRHGWWNILDELLCGSIGGCCFMLGGLIALHVHRKPKESDNIMSRYVTTLDRSATSFCLGSLTAKCAMIAAGFLVGTYCPPMFSEGGSTEQIIMSVLGLFSIALGFILVSVEQ